MPINGYASIDMIDLKQYDLQLLTSVQVEGLKVT